MVEHPTATWEAMRDGNTFYRRQQLYTVTGKLPYLGDYIVSGYKILTSLLLAVMRDISKLVALGPGQAATSLTKSQVQLYSPAGGGFPLLSWDQGRIICFGWTADERLVVVNEEGVYRLYDLQGDYQQHSLGSEAAELGLMDVRIQENGLVAMTGALTLLEVKGWDGGRPLTLASLGLTEPPHVWSVIPPDVNISRHVEVLLSVDSTILSVDHLEVVDQRISRGPFTHISPSPNGKALALLTLSGLLWAVSTDFQRSMAEFDTNTVYEAEGPVRQVEWCGNDAILVTWDTLVVLVGPYGDTLKFLHSGPTFAITESDGVRIIGPDICDMIQKVPSE
ncbi:hypothetical protein C0989_004971 [Termitomyces sp. Mn162]|nr:hypothetical protein C0989_004971 [Termitomyces sp. Mn162]